MPVFSGSAITRPGPHGTTMRAYGSFAGKSAEAGGSLLVFMMQLSNQYSGGMTEKVKQ